MYQYYPKINVTHQKDNCVSGLEDEELGSSGAFGEDVLLQYLAVVQPVAGLLCELDLTKHGILHITCSQSSGDAISENISGSLTQAISSKN